jgi:DNA polymerase-3 subunit alpha
MVASVRRIVTKSNRSMAIAVLEDLSGRVDLVLFPDTCERFGGELKEGAIIDVRGRLDRRGETLQIVCDSIASELPRPVAQRAEPDAVLIRFGVAADSWTEIRSMQQVDEILKKFEGENPVIVEVPASQCNAKQLKCRNRHVGWSMELAAELQAVAGVVSADIVLADQIRLAS